MIDLNGSDGSIASVAYAINNAGQVVGLSSNGATMWDGSSITDLNSFVDAATAAAGWMLGSAAGINDQGSIIGNAWNLKTNEQAGFLLAVTAVPEPGIYGIFMMGLCLMGFVVYRRRPTLSKGSTLALTRKKAA